MTTRKTLSLVLVLAFIVSMFAAVPAFVEKKLVYGYVTPGPDTWHKRDVEGFQRVQKG